MKKAHRRFHAVVWISLLPVLLGFVYLANKSPARAIPQTEVVRPSEAGVLP